MKPLLTIPNGSYKFYAFFNDGRENALGVFELMVREQIPSALVAAISTTAGEEKVWRVLDLKHLEAGRIGDASYVYRQMLHIPADLTSKWEERYGHVRPFVHAEANGMRFVSAGKMVFHSAPNGKPWKYVTDFLKVFVEQMFGHDWFLSENKKPDSERHQIVKFHRALYDQLQKAEKDEKGEYPIRPCGLSNCFYNLAYDLFLLQDNDALPATLIHRLKNKDQFQGARHEVFAAASCIRAGFQISYSDQSKKPAEFIATHVTTGLQIAVEAKSRHRAGVLDANIPGKKKPNPKAAITQLLNKALEKTVCQPYVIVVDLNLPVSPEPPFRKKWFQEVHGSIFRALGDSTPTKRDKFNMLVFTNHPWHYGKNDQPSPPLEPGTFLMTKYPERQLSNDTVLGELRKAVEVFGNVPRGFPTNAE